MDHLLDFVCSVRVEKHHDVDTKSFGLTVRIGNANNAIFLFTQDGVDRQRGGQRTFGGPIPGGRRPLSLGGLRGGERLEETHSTCRLGIRADARPRAEWIGPSR